MSMKRGHLIAGIACLTLLFLLVQGAMASPIERSVIPAGNSTYRVVLTMPEGTVAGITETLPEGITVSDVSLPSGQYQTNGTTLTLAVIEEQEVSYLITLNPGVKGEILGTSLSMLTGEKSSLPGALISGSGTVEIIPAGGENPAASKDTSEHTAPLGPAVIGGALATLGIGYSLRRRSP